MCRNHRGAPVARSCGPLGKPGGLSLKRSPTPMFKANKIRNEDYRGHGRARLPRSPVCSPHHFVLRCVRDTSYSRITATTMRFPGSTSSTLSPTVV
jgi:hypothetical protein